MNKYASLLADAYSVFETLDWKAEDIKTFPEDFVGTGVGNEYIRVAVLAGNVQYHSNPISSVAGQMIIDIFTPAGAGPLRRSQIADKLDTYLAGKVFTLSTNGSTQFASSTLVGVGNDKDNPSLYRSIYSIPFNYFGV